jgi:hypothetical protein
MGGGHKLLEHSINFFIVINNMYKNNKSFSSHKRVHFKNIGVRQGVNLSSVLLSIYLKTSKHLKKSGTVGSRRSHFMA